MKYWKDKQEFKERVRFYAKKIGVKYNLLSMRSMKRKWASCSTSGNFSFDKELLKLDKEIGDYVIVHELLHIRIPNHGKLWKSLMTAYLGDYKKIETRLQKIRKYDIQ